jgi:hypothetical protein
VPNGPDWSNEYQKQIPFYRARLLVKPGLTGWAQINYGYVSSVTETVIKLEYDLYYIKHRTLAWMSPLFCVRSAQFSDGQGDRSMKILLLAALVLLGRISPSPCCEQGHSCPCAG